MRYLLLLSLLFGLQMITAQEDIISWSAIQLKTKSYNGFSFTAKPIVRHNQDLSNYTNTSIDLAIAKNIGNGFKIQYLYRHWWMEDSPNRVFWWFDIAHSYKASPKLSISNRVRWHIAMDWLTEDPNFLRYLPVMRYQLTDRLSLALGYEIWFQLDDINDWRRMRPQIGARYKINERLDFDFLYWYERSIGIEPYFLNHILNLAFFYKL